MKKLGLLVMPLMAISLLASCNKGLDEPKPLEECTWEKISEVSKADKASKWFKVGDTKTVKVNNQDHKVRIIGFNQDKDLDNKPIGITFEFVNLISDFNGCSLATLWNEGIKTKLGEASFDYLNSSIRKALNGSGSAERFLWAEKGEAVWSERYKDKTVLDMLPIDLNNVLKKPVKIVPCVNNFGRWVETEFTDKLFLLRNEEIGFYDNESPDTFTYSYYEGHTEKKDTYRIKKQVDTTKIVEHPVQIPNTEGQFSGEEVFNYAGYNDSNPINGGYSLLRLPFNKAPISSVWNVLYNGSMDAGTTYQVAAGVAPAFCI